MLPGNVDDVQNFSHAPHKALPAEVLLDAISQATGTTEEFEGWPSGIASDRDLGQQATVILLPHLRVARFARRSRECERSNEPSIAQALHIMNSPEIEAKIHTASGPQRAKLAASDRPVDQIMDELFLSTISRYPTADETNGDSARRSRRGSRQSGRQSPSCHGRFVMGPAE